MRRALVCLLLALAGCAENPLVGADPSTSLAPASLDFGSVYLQSSVQRSLTFTNTGRARDVVSLSVHGAAGFTSAVQTLQLEGGASAQVSLSFAPLTSGASSATVHCEWSGGSADVPLTGAGLAWLDCPSTNACLQRAFSPELGACVDTPVAEGTPCVDATGCLTNSTCVAGECRGQLLDCDDGNACTTDVCAPNLGCQHLPATDRCPSEDPCQIPSCDPVLGCQVTPAPDGTSCGVTRDCRTSGVCLSGRCQEAVAPDGTACTLDWAPCAGDATCHGGECVSPSASQWTPGQVLWRYEADGGSNTYLEVHAVDDAGNSYLAQWGPQQLLSLDACGRERWKQPTGAFTFGVMLEGGQVFAQEGGRFVARDAVSGQARWSFDVAQAFGYCDGGPCGATLQGNPYAAPAVLSSGGQILLSGLAPGPVSQLEVLAVSTAGQLEWTSSLGPSSCTVGGANAVADTGGNLYTYGWASGPSVLPGASVLSVVDPLGRRKSQVGASSRATSPSAPTSCSISAPSRPRRGARTARRSSRSRRACRRIPASAAPRPSGRTGRSPSRRAWRSTRPRAGRSR